MGIDGFESESETLVRECLEETGWRVAPAGLVGRARQWVSRPAVGKFRDKACSFYRIDLVERLGPPTDERHTVEWMPLERAARCLHYDSHRWALAQALRGTTAP